MASHDLGLVALESGDVPIGAWKRLIGRASHAETMTAVLADLGRPASGWWNPSASCRAPSWTLAR